MTAQQKQSIMDIQRNLHQVMTIVGFPILLILVGDMYADFKRVRSNDIRQDERLNHIERDHQETKQALQSMGNFVYRGIK